jgi:hypothetical protein
MRYGELRITRALVRAHQMHMGYFIKTVNFQGAGANLCDFFLAIFGFAFFEKI